MCPNVIQSPKFANLLKFYPRAQNASMQHFTAGSELRKVLFLELFLTFLFVYATFQE